MVWPVVVALNVTVPLLAVNVPAFNQLPAKLMAYPVPFTVSSVALALMVNPPPIVFAPFKLPVKTYVSAEAGVNCKLLYGTVATLTLPGAYIEVYFTVPVLGVNIPLVFVVNGVATAPAKVNVYAPPIARVSYESSVPSTDIESTVILELTVNLLFVAGATVSVLFIITVPIF